MDIKVEQYTFYNDGNLYTNNQKHIGKRQYQDVPEKADLSIIIVGTETQTDKLFKKYIKQHNLALDECYEITNDIAKNKMDIVEKRYINNNKKAFII